MLSRDASPAATITTEGIVTHSMEFHNTPLTGITAGRPLPWFHGFGNKKVFTRLSPGKKKPKLLIRENHTV
jgi:hypothetical protein